MPGYALLLCSDVIYPPLVLLFGRVEGWKGSLATYRGNKRPPPTPRDPWSEGPAQSKDTQGAGGEGPGMPFGMVGPLSWKPTREGVSLTVLPPLHATEEGCNNKNTG